MQPKLIGGYNLLEPFPRIQNCGGARQRVVFMVRLGIISSEARTRPPANPLSTGKRHCSSGVVISQPLDCSKRGDSILWTRRLLLTVARGRQAAKCQDEGELRQMIREPDSDALANQDQDNEKPPDFLPPAGRRMFLQPRSSYSTTPVWRPGARVRL